MTTAEFIHSLQDYYGGRYTPTQIKEVAAWSDKRSDRSRYLVYKYCVATGETQYKTPPDIRTLNVMLAEVMEAYPELRADSYNRQVTLDSKLLSEGEFTDGERFLQILVKAMQTGPPAENPEVIRILRENGYTIGGDDE